MDRTDALVEAFMGQITARTPDEPEFLQAVEEVAGDVLTVEKAHRDWAAAKVLERLTVPDRILEFRITWRDDAGDIQTNRGWRVQGCNALGPYKGGLRFHPDITRSVLKFLAFEQSFKNALTGLPMGGAKGGADFDPKGRSLGEVERFCTAFMTELGNYIGPDRDIPAGDINVGAREIGFLFGSYLRQGGKWNGALTGKGRSFGGSALRTEATGYGLIYFLGNILAARKDSMEGARIAISGMGNVALYAAEKAICEGGNVIALSDSGGTLHAPDGLTHDALNWVRETKGAGESVASSPRDLGLSYAAGEVPWGLDCDIALPCATQNELDGEAAQALIDGPCRAIAEGANMPLTADAQAKVRASDMIYAPGKAANAGGVAVSGLEMSQNSHGQYLSREAVDDALKDIMGSLHDRLSRESGSGTEIDYVRAANTAAYRQLADAITHLGV